MPHSNWSFPTSVRFGAGRVDEVAEACTAAGIVRPLVITDPGMVELRAIAAVTGTLTAAGVEHGLFADVHPNPVGNDVEAGIEVFRRGGHDGIVAIGGGSALDVGKIVAFQAGQRRPVWDFEDIGDNWTLADATTIAPVVAVPTTAGTGSEVGRAGVVIDEERGRKVIVFHPRMLPSEVICDPELTVGLPATLTVGTGIDALSHSLEALCAPGYHPMADGIALEGCRLVIEHLPRVIADPADIDSRGHMMAAAVMGAVAFQKGLGGIHALSHPISVRFGTHHGMTNAVLMPYVLTANRDAAAEPVERLARHVGIPGGFDGFLDHVVELRASTGVPHTLLELGVDPAARDGVAADSLAEPPAAGNPRPFTLELASSIFDAACSGRIEP